MTYVIDPQDGTKLPCMWADCFRPGREEHKAVVRQPHHDVHYVFCTEGHRMLWINGHISFGNRPMGSRGVIT